ncbi:MAG: MlaD family protein, partial [Bdellovibrionota bacterium]
MSQNMKVAALFIAAIAGLVGIVFLLTGGVVRNASTLYVTYNFAGGVQTGTPVRVAGIQVGKVRKIEFLGGDPSQDEHVRLTVDIDARAMESVRADSQFYINMAGIIGERYVEISTGTKDSPQLQDEDTVRGVDPPRLDQLISQGYGVMGEILDIIEKNREKFENMIAALDALFKNFDPENMEAMAGMITNMASLVKAMNRDLPPVLRKARPVLEQANDAFKDLNPLLEDVREAVATARVAMKDKDLAQLLEQMFRMFDNADGALKGADHLLGNLAFVDENWIRHFLQIEGIRAYAGFGAPVIPDGSRPKTPAPLPKSGRAPAKSPPAASK